MKMKNDLKMKNGRTSHSGYYLPKAEIKDTMLKLMAKTLFIGQ